MAVSLAKDQDKFVLRMPDGLREKLKTVADANNRSMNAEIISRLEFSLIAHPHAFLIRALLDMQEALLGDLRDLELPRQLSHDLVKAAKARGLAPETLGRKLLSEALDYLDDDSELGKEFARRVFEQHHKDE